MSTFFNKGNQQIRWQYQLPLEAKPMNQMFLGVLPLGIYSGFTLTRVLTAAGMVEIAPGVLEIKDDTNEVQVKCQTNESYILSGVTSANPYIHVYYEWNEKEAWFADFVASPTAAGTSANKISNYICLGEVSTFVTSGVVWAFDYTHRQPAVFPVKPNLSQIQDELYRILSAGPGIRIIYHQDLGLIEISARYSEADHHLLEGLSADDHTQYLLTDGSRPLTGSWNAGAWTISGTGISSLTADSISAADSTQLWHDGVTFPYYNNNRMAQVICAGSGITLTYSASAGDAGTLSIASDVSSEGEGLSVVLKTAILAGNYGNSNSEGNGSLHTRTINVKERHVGANYWTDLGRNGAIKGYGAGCAHHAGRIYYVGGYDTSDLTDAAGCYDPGVESGVTLDDVDRKIYRPATFSMFEFLLYTNGRGKSEGTPLKDIYPRQTFIRQSLGSGFAGSNYWQSRDSTTYPHGEAIGWPLNYCGYLMGGISGGEITPDLSARHVRCERWRPYEDVWVRISDAPHYFWQAGSFELDGFGFAFRENYEDWKNMYMYDPSLDVWKSRNDCEMSVEYDGISGYGDEVGFVTSFSVNGFGYGCAGQYAPSGSSPWSVSVCASPSFYQTKVTIEYSKALDLWSRREELPQSGSQWAGAGWCHGFIGGKYPDDTGRQWRYNNTTMYEIPGAIRLSNNLPHEDRRDQLQIGAHIDHKYVNLPIWLSCKNELDNYPDFPGHSPPPYENNQWRWWQFNPANVNTSIPGMSWSLPTYGRWRYGERLLRGDGWDGATEEGYYEYRIRLGVPSFDSMPGSGGASANSLRGYWAVKRATMPERRTSGAAIACNGYGWYFFGSSAASPADSRDTILRYEDEADSWIIAKTESTYDRNQGTAIAMGGKIYHCGGGEGTPSDVVFVFDDTILTNTTLGSMSNSRTGACGFAINGYAYITMGGTSNPPVSNTTNSTERYNVALNAWEAVANIQEGRYLPTSISMRGEGLVFSGKQGALYRAPTYKYIPHLNSWSIRASIETARNEAASFTSRGFAFTFGGSDGSALDSCVRFNDDLNAWDTTTELLTAKYGHGGFVLNRYGYAAGGYDGSSVLDEVEKFVMQISPEKISMSLYVVDE